MVGWWGGGCVRACACVRVCVCACKRYDSAWCALGKVIYIYI